VWATAKQRPSAPIKRLKKPGIESRKNQQNHKLDTSMGTYCNRIYSNRKAEQNIFAAQQLVLLMLTNYAETYSNSHYREEET
jgi:hypothetical protein